MKILLDNSVQSSAVKTLAYDVADATLYVEFKKTEDVWAYEDVPEDVYGATRCAQSVGSAFAKTIKGKYSEKRVTHSNWNNIVRHAQNNAKANRKALEAANRRLIAGLREGKSAVRF